MASNAKMIDCELYKTAGINPALIHRHSLPKLGADTCMTPLKDNLLSQFSTADREIAATRYKWSGLPVGMSSQDLERLLYLKGNLALFYLEELNQFFILPYALDGDIDVYGRDARVRPIPLASVGPDDSPELKAKVKALNEFFSGKSYEVQYDVVTPEELLEDPDRYILNSCVLLHDYTRGLGQTVVPRVQLQQPLLEVMSNIVPYLNTALMNSTGVSGVRVANMDEAQQVDLAANAVQSASLNGKKWIPMKGQLDFQDFARSPIGASQDFLLALQSLQNLEISFFGLENGGIYQKKSHMLQSEYDANTGSPITALIYKDGLDNRQRFRDIANSIWGEGIDVRPFTIDEMMDAMGGVPVGDDSMPMDEIDTTKEEENNDINE